MKKNNDKEGGDMGIRMNKGVFETGEMEKSYASKLSSGINENNELFFIPTGMKEKSWSVRGISALASRLGRPIKMDQVTAEMCKAGVGRLGYARVLIEINAEDEFLDKIEINYVDEMRKVKSTKWGSNGVKSPSKVWNVGKDNVEELRKSANKYDVLSEDEDHIEEDPFIHKRLIVDKFIKKKIQPTCQETKNWNYDMVNYFKYQWEVVERKEKEDSEEEDVKYSVLIHFRIASWNIRGMCKELKQKEAWALMGDFNGTLKPEEHSNRASSMSIDMNEFKDVVNKMEAEDLCSTGFQFTNLFDKASSLKEKLKEAQSKMDADPSDLAKRQITMELVNEYTIVAEDELKLLHQKVKIHWLKEEDKNSSYFHNILKARKNRSRIESICCEDGSRVEGDLVNGKFVKNFQKFLGTTLPVSSLSSISDIVKLKLSEAEALYMIKDVSDKEIKEALFDIDSSKAAGPDGYTSCFFKKAWGIIGAKVAKMARRSRSVREFFVTRRILGEINATLIALVPKINTSTRINEGLSKVVSLNQSAFIPRRHIQDNILITQELLKGYNRKNGENRCAIKIDIWKAYDTIIWEFLKEAMLM
nr:hypothetical protein [Tanacetum cinerariifolium]